MQAQTPRWFTATTRSKFSSGSSAASDGGTGMPALLNGYRCRNPRFFGDVARQIDGATIADDLPCFMRSELTVQIAHTTTEAPLSANMRTVASPIPLAAPVPVRLCQRNRSEDSCVSPFRPLTKGPGDENELQTERRGLERILAIEAVLSLAIEHLRRRAVLFPSLRRAPTC